MKYECKENDCLIEMGRDKSEILISAQGETAKTVIGLKDLKQALILFGVSHFAEAKELCCPNPACRSKNIKHKATYDYCEDCRGMFNGQYSG